jgi:hypothetical protein
MRDISLSGILLLLAATALPADEMRPANFEHEEEKRRLYKLIAFPKMTRDATIMLHCVSQIAANGKMKETGCYTKDQFDSDFAAAVVRGAKKARLTPAIVNGKAQKVYLQFRVEFIAEKDRRSIFLYLNNGYTENVEAYGYKYIAAQRVIGKERWQDICPQRANYLMTLRAYVGEDGQPGSPSLEKVRGIMPTIDCQNAIKDTILTSAFTPGIADGYPVPSSYVELFGN